jgi:hypothetical protein
VRCAALVELLAGWALVGAPERLRQGDVRAGALARGRAVVEHRSI